MVDPRVYIDDEYRRAVERCLECDEREECELFLHMQQGGYLVTNCPKGRANVI